MAKKTKKEKREQIEKIAVKSILFKPFVFKKIYRNSRKKIKKIINESIKKFTDYDNLPKEERTYLRRDIAYCRIFYRINTREYFLYGFRNKSHFKRKNFIGNQYRQDYLYLLGTEKGQMILRDKYEAYKILKPFYKRDIVKLSNQKDYNVFLDYINKHPIFVKKPINLSFGAGIKLIDSNKYSDKKELFNVLMQDGEVLLEEQIISDEKMASLHPSSLNTVRIVTYRDKNDNVFIHLPFIKVGRGGSFVDNGGAGGMLALIDPETGIIKTNAKDENNVVYEKHPDTNIDFIGFKIPKWEEMVSLAKEAALNFDETRYIGFDVALSKDKGPVIVEGNGKTQFYGQQIPDEVGKKKDLEKLINYKKLLKENKNLARWELKSPKKKK